MIKLFHPIQIACLKHELWVARWSCKIPIFSLFLIFTLLLWIMPIVPIIIFVIEFDTSQFPTLALLVLRALLFLINIVLVLFLCGWLFRWYFAAVGLIVGTGEMMMKKEEDVKTRLERTG